MLPIAAVCLRRFVLVLALAAIAVTSFAEEKPAKSYSIIGQLTTTSNVQPVESVDYSASQDVDLTTSYKFPTIVSLALDLNLSREYTGEGLTKVGDGYLRANFSALNLSNGLKLSADLINQLPLSEDSRDRSSLYTATTLRPNLSADLSELNIKGLSVVYRVGFTRYIHQFTTSTTGASNNQYSISNRIDVMYSFLEKYSATLINNFSTTWSYAQRQRNSFSFRQELGFDITNKFSAQLGHSNQAGSLKADGRSSNVALFNETTSSVYTGVSYVY